MKNILTILLLTFAVSSFGQTYGWMIRIDPGQDADTANMGIMYPDGSGNLTGRMHFVSYATVLEKLAAFSPDTVYVNAGDSLVIVSIHGDTTYFAGGGAGGANTALSNLVSTAVNTDILPANQETQSLGSNAKRWNRVYSLYLSLGGGGHNIVLANIGSDSADRTLGINLNNSNRELSMFGGLIVSGDADVSGTNTGDQDLSAYSLDANVVHKTGDETINGEKTFNDSLRVDDYAAFLGTDGGYATKIEALKSGRLKFSKYNNTGNDYYTWLQIDDIQTGHGNVPWYSNVGTTSFVGDDLNNFTLTQGFNLSGSGAAVEAGKPAWGESWEYHYAPSVSQILSEWHRFFVDSSGVQHRVESEVIDHGDLDSWYKYNTLHRYFVTDPNNDQVWFDMYRDGTNGANIKLFGSGTGTGAMLYVSGAGNLAGLYNQGMTDPHLYLFDSGTSFVHMRYLDFWPSGNPATSMIGMGGDGFATSMTYAVAADSLDLYMTSKVNVSDTAAMLSNYIDRSSAETIYGVKTFNADPVVPAEAYGSGWNGSNEPPTKNDVYDKIETLGGSTDYVISPAQLTSDQDNYNPTGFGKATIVRLSSDNGIRAITSLVDSTGGVHIKKIINVGSYSFYFPMDHPDGTASNRVTGMPGDLYLYPGMTINIWYDATSSRWRIIGTTEIDKTPSVGSYYSVCAGSTTAGDNSILGFTAVGTGNINQAGPWSYSPLAFEMGTSTSSTAGYNISLVKGGFAAGYTGSSACATECQMFIPTLSDGTQTFQAQLTLLQGPTGGTNAPNNSIGIRYSNGINSGKFEGFSVDGSGGTASADLGITVAANTLYTLRIELDKSRTEARFYIDGAYVGRLTSALPNASVGVGSRVLLLKSAGATARYIEVSSLMFKSIYK